MIRIELWWGNYLRARWEETTDQAAYRRLDAVITALHAGEHGHGLFRLEADYLNDIGLFDGAFFRTAPITIPRADLPDQSAA